MKTKLFTLFLTLFFSVGELFAAEQVQIGDLYYNLNETTHTAEVTSHPNFTGYSGSIVIPASVSYNATNYSVTSIEQFAFQNCSDLTSIKLSNSVTNIGHYAFSGCSSLASIAIPNSVTSIGEGAFSGCTSFTSIYIPNSVTNIGSSAFANCGGVTSIIVESGNSYYDSRNDCAAIIETSSSTLIRGCSNSIIPNTIMIIGEDAFSGSTNLTSVAIPNSVTCIKGNAFEGCINLISIAIPNSVMEIHAGAFAGCNSLTSITIPNGITEIKRYTFFGCSSLTLIDIPNSITEIESYAFAECSGLTSLTIPSNVTKFGKYVFERCIGLTSVTINAATPPQIGVSIFRDVDCSQIPLYVPAESIDSYKAADQWKEFNPILPIADQEEISIVSEDVYDSNKVIRNGQVLILRGDHTYTLTGQEVK